MRPFKSGLVLLASLILVACNSGMHAGLKTFKDEVFTPSADVRKFDLQAQYRYLLVEQKGQEALLVWIGVESHPLGPVNLWISADGVVIRTVNGRLLGVTEPQRQWRLQSQTISPAAASPSKNPRFLQTTDEQPGFRMGVVREIEQRDLAPTDAAARGMAKWFNHPAQLHWIEEVDAANGERLALYGLDAENQTVGGQRCISPQWCIRWQAWPPKAPAAKL